MPVPGYESLGGSERSGMNPPATTFARPPAEPNIITQTYASANVRKTLDTTQWFYLSLVPFKNFGFSIVPSIRNGNDNLPSFNLAPSKRANVFVQKSCLVVMVATP